MTDKKNSGEEAIVGQGKFYSWTELRGMIQKGEVSSGQSLAGLYLAEQWLSRSGKRF